MRGHAAADTAPFTPFEIAFLRTGQAKWDRSESWTVPRFLINRLLDLYFLLDLCAQFVISVRPRSHEEAARQATSITGAWVDDKRKIAKRYFTSGWVRGSDLSPRERALSLVTGLSRGCACGDEPRPWQLFFDIFTIMPSFLDMVPTLFPEITAEVGNGFVLRTLRVLRLTKILRVIRVRRLGERWCAAEL